ncbi:CLD6 protein, partial [Pachyramphus minor]|nr:CLD6 protein [Pachyramphus minor]
MGSTSMYLSGLVTTLVGWVASIIICAVPMWRVTSLLGSGTMASQSYSDGLWVTCAYESTGQSQCRSYNSLLEVTPDLLVGRVMVVTSLITSFVAFTLLFADQDFSSCMGGIKNRFTSAAGSSFITAGVLVLIPVSWTASNIINNFYTPMVPEAVTRELGASLYIGWISSVLLMFGGLILCRVAHRFQQESYLKNYKGVKTCGPTGYPMKDYV